MIIGNRNQLAFELRPLSPTWKQRYVPELVGWASLSLIVGGINLCEHTRPGSDRLIDAVNVPLIPIADWLAQAWAGLAFEERAAAFTTPRQPHEALAIWGVAAPPAGISEDDWVDAREDWWSRHFLAAGADGAYLPSVAFARQDDELVISWAQARLAGEDPPQFVAAPGERATPWSQAESTFREFVATVGAWASDAGLGTVYDWAVPPFVVSSRTDDLRTALPLFTGKTIQELQRISRKRTFKDLVQWLGLDEGSRDPAAGTISQALRDLPSGLSPTLGDLLSSLDRETRHPNGPGEPKWLASRAIALDAARDAGSPEEAGQLASRALRSSWGIGASPVGDTQRLLQDQDVRLPVFDAQALTERLVMGARLNGSAVAIVISTPRTRTAWGLRFEHVRAIGHLLLDPFRGDAIGAASSPSAQSTRRRRSGAFAAEFLLPEEVLIEATGGALDAAATEHTFRVLLHDYGVGARTAANQLYNHRLLSSTAVRDDLIEEFGH